MSDRPIYYGRRAYEGFAKAFASKVGVRVAISDNANMASVDDRGVISLPAINTYQTQSEFEDTCATVMHEVSHVLYGSHKEFARHKTKSKLWRDCFNAVLDIADETAIGKRDAMNGNDNCDKMLTQACANAASNPDLAKSSKAPAHWRILSTGIIRTRCMGKLVQHKGKTVKYTSALGAHLVKEFPNLDIKAVYAAMLKARNGRRHPYRHWSYITLANQLETLLKDVAPPDDGQDSPMPGGTGKMPGSGSGGAGTGTPEEGEGEGQANSPFGKGEQSLPQGADEAGEAEGAAQADPNANSASPGRGQTDPNADPSKPGSGAGQGASARQQTYACYADQSCYNEMLPIVKRVADRLANDGEAITNQGGFVSGTGVRDAYKICTGEPCMGRWTMDEHADGMSVAVLLDISGSMQGILSKVCGIAGAFSDGMEACANVKRWVFGEDATEVEHFRHCDYEGSTETEKALFKARAWLRTQSSGQKLLVCITDGEPYSVSATQTQTREAMCEGVKVIGVALGGDKVRSDIFQSMPGATIIHAPDVVRLAIALEGITLAA